MKSVLELDRRYGVSRGHGHLGNWRRLTRLLQLSGVGILGRHFGGWDIGSRCGICR